MILKTSRIVYSRTTLIPWNAIDTQPAEIPDRGLHWGTRESDFIVSGGNSKCPIRAKAKLIAKLKGTK